MKKLIALICAAALLMSLAAVPAGAEGGKALKILIVTSSGVDDGNFNQDCYAGIQSFLADHDGCTVQDIKEPNFAELIPTVEKSVGDYDVFVLPGFNFGMVGDIVLANPDKYFLVVDSTIMDSEGNPVTAENAFTMTYKEQEGGFMAGVAAAVSSQSGKVAVITGMPYPSNLNYQFGFMGGVQYANAKYGTAVRCVEIPSFSGGDGVGGNYVGAFDDEATGKVVAETLIAEGCDVLFAAAGQSGNGVLTAVKEASGIWFIGCDVDQYDDGRKGEGNVVLTSALKVMHLDVQRQLEAICNGTFAGQDALLGADTDSTGYVSAEGRQQLSEDALNKLAECYELIKTGAVVPPTTPEGVADFPGLN
ncbi:MAG: BMP family ABC transporter substrate-binding protein [Clostridia bacterium]|nr:BMP family ABC transporter substrate-binding protein [Clostridia bacterium]